jgi:cellobiose transport system substrate-binding protein
MAETTRPSHEARAGSIPRALFGAPLALLCILASCSAGTASDTVRFWSFTGIQQERQVNEYLRDHPDAKIELSEVGTSMETADALVAALAGGVPPDLVLIQADDLPRFVAAGDRFRDLRDFGAGRLQEQYLPWAWDAAVTADGSVIGVPTDVGGMSLAYRADLFATAGLPTDPADVARLWPTWEEFIDTGEEFTDATGIPFVDNASTTVFVNMSNQLAVKYYGDDGELVFASNDDLQDSFDTALDAHRSGISAGLAAFTPGWSAGMADGAFAVVAAPSWMLRVITSTAPDSSGNWRITPVPGVAGNWGGSYLAIPEQADNADEAWAYIAQMQSPAAQLEHFEAGGPLPAARAPYDDEALRGYADAFFGSSRIGEVLAASIRGMPTVRQGPDANTINSAFLQALTAVEEGSLSPARAWDTAVASIEVSLRDVSAEAR